MNAPTAPTTTGTEQSFRLERSFEASPGGVEQAGEAVVGLLTDRGQGVYAERAERVATILVSWLARNESSGGQIRLEVRFDGGLREVVISARDSGTMLPVLRPADELRWQLQGLRTLDTGARQVTGGRILWCTIGL